MHAVSPIKVESGCITRNPDGSKSIKVLVSHLSAITAGPKTVYIWIKKTTTSSGLSSSDYFSYNITVPPILFTGGTFTFNIPPGDYLSLGDCYQVFAGETMADAPYQVHPDFNLATSICPCATDACYVYDPNSAAPLVVKVTSPCIAPGVLYVYTDDPTSPGFYLGAVPTTTLAYTGSGYERTATITGIATGSMAGAPLNVYESDVSSDPLSFISGQAPNDPANSDNWTTKLVASPCQGNTAVFSSRCITIDGMTGDQLVTVNTNSSAGPIYMWSAGYGPVPSSSVTADGLHPGNYIATFNLSTFGPGINITMECHTFYFSTTPVNPAPGHPVLICPCSDEEPKPATYGKGCLYKDPATGRQTITVETDNNSVPNYMWVLGYGGMATQIITTANPAYPGAPGSKPFLATFDLVSIGGGTMLSMSCHTFYFSNTPTFPMPSTPITICPCEQPVVPVTFSAGCLYIDGFGNQIVSAHTSSASGPVYMWSGFGPVLYTGVRTMAGPDDYIIYFDLTAFGVGITMACHTFYFSSTTLNPYPANPVTICPCPEAKQAIGKQNQAFDKTNAGVVIYPNPAKGKVTIEFELAAKSKVQILLTDQLGQTIQTIADKNMEAGSQSVNFNSELLANGLYFIKIWTGNSMVTKPLTILK